MLSKLSTNLYTNYKKIVKKKLSKRPTTNNYLLFKLFTLKEIRTFFIIYILKFRL